MAGLSKSIKKRKLVTKIFFFSDNVEWSFKRNTIFLEIQCKKGHVFFIWFWLVFYPSWCCPLRTLDGWGAEGGGVVLSRQNLLSVMKVICRQSLRLVGLSWYLRNKERKVAGFIWMVWWVSWTDWFFLKVFTLVFIFYWL